MRSVAPRVALVVLLAALVAVLCLASPAAAQVDLEPDEAPATTTTTGARRDLPRTILEAEQRDDGGSSPLPWVLSGIGAVVAIGIGGTILGRRSRG